MDKQLQQLQDNLHKQLAAYEQLLLLAQRKLQVIRKAEHKQLPVLLTQENQQVQIIGQLETGRLQLVAQITLMLDPDASEPLRLEQLAERLPEPMRGKLLVLRQQLKARMEAVRNEIGVIRRVSEALLKHMQGLVQTVGATLTGIGVYSRGGNLPRAATAISTFTTTG